MKRLLFVLLSPLLLAQEKVDLYTINRIKAEEFQDSKVMENAFYLTDVYGPRLTGSPGLKAAGEWAVRQMTEWGLANPNMEKWGPFGRGWTCVHFSAEQKEPQFAPLMGFAQPWSPGTNGMVSGEPILAVLRTEADLEKFKGKLKGKIVLLQDPRVLGPETEPDLKRYSDDDLNTEAQAPEPGPRPMFGMFGNPGATPPYPYPGRPARPMGPNGQPFDREARAKFRDKVNQFLVDEGVLLTLTPSYRPTSGVIFGAAAGSQDPKKPLPPPAVALELEQYNRIARLIEKKIPVTLAFDIQNKFFDDTQDSFTVVGEIPGTTKKDELVMLGAHLDSWTGGTGATDNGAGSVVVLEAMRILKALDLKMPRTVRMALWTGEEEGLLGSRAYVKEHFADRETMALKPEHAKLSGYFNLDNGTGKIRGVYLQGNDMMRPIFQAWLDPFKDLGASTVTIRNTGGTDHQSFDAVGLPGFQFIQDPMDYSSETHHSTADTYDHLVAGDLMEASAIMAAIVYDAATRDEMLPRKPLPKPEPPRRREGAQGAPVSSSGSGK
ncbi:MAG TPA: M20/M25/M40 family metallo-hydrolase [Bryobacteraceae bacterium]|nr:M20/M25/M40 family metallo-hydrolase [Bryobacteraceae bacterium]